MGLFQSHYMLSMLASGHINRIQESLLSELVKEDSMGPPIGAIALTAFGVHIFPLRFITHLQPL